MLTLFARAFRVPELRKKMLFTLSLLVLFRFGQVLPSPGVDVVAVQRCLGAARGGLAEMMQLFSGGAMLKLSVFALGVMPYITASIVMQLMAVLIPRLELMRKAGEQQKITQYTRYLTVGLAVLNATTVVALARTGQLFPGCQERVLRDDGLLGLLVLVAVMVAGTCAVMWLGELITDRGIGNGMSLLMFTQVVAVFPAYMSTIFQMSAFAAVIILVSGVFLVAAVVFMEQAQRRIPVQYARRMIGSRTYGNTSTYIPLKVNQAGIVPVIFTASLLYVPTLFAGQLPWLAPYLQGDHPLYMTGYFALIVAFAYFYVSLTFNAQEVADQMRRYGGFVPGIRPGRPTAGYLSYVLSRLTAPGSLYLGVLALLPLVAFALLRDPSTQQNFPFGGTSVLIMVGVGLETVKQVEYQLLQRNYERLLT
ncbi:preprotein translocase subunit SecY [Nonomuraea typhae]|uniref:preprotein translocase subunit SecY n=1 Tax=Nonomuraea typhae TaxID=2603600 RepID=UPI0012FAFFC6|nr:preprotein translocase subunit SecY [Nonomuraea typhae]